MLVRLPRLGFSPSRIHEDPTIFRTHLSKSKNAMNIQLYTPKRDLFTFCSISDWWHGLPKGAGAYDPGNSSRISPLLDFAFIAISFWRGYLFSHMDFRASWSPDGCASVTIFPFLQFSYICEFHTSIQNGPQSSRLLHF